MIPYKIIVDTKRLKTYGTNTIEVKQGDKDSRVVSAIITADGVPLDLTNKTVTFYAIKPDKTKIFNSTTIKKASAGEIEFKLTTQVLAIEGMVKGELVVFGADGYKLTSALFVIDIIKSINDESAIESQNEFTLLADALTKLTTWDNQFETKYNGLEQEYATELTTVTQQLAETVTQIENIEQQLEDGTAGIDDNIISNAKVWSSAKTEEQIQSIPKGLNAYELWLSQGNTGTINDFYRNALRIFVNATEPVNPQDGDIWFMIPIEPEKPMPVTDCLFRFDASKLGLFDNDKVSEWKDLGNNGNDLMQASASSQPTYLAEGLNGKPTVMFNNSILDSANLLLDRVDGMTLFIVAKYNTVDASQSLFNVGEESSSASVTNRIRARMSGSAKKLVLDINSLAQVGAPMDTTPYIFTASYNNVEVAVSKNGVKGERKALTGNISIGENAQIRLGRNLLTSVPDTYSGLISEVIYFSRALSDDELEQMHTYLKNKWGI